MKSGTTYYKLWNPDYDAVAAVYRIRYEPNVALDIERYDPAAGAWTVGPGTFLRFVNEGEDGADEIPEAEALELIRRGLPRLPVLEPVG